MTSPFLTPQRANQTNHMKHSWISVSQWCTLFNVKISTFSNSNTTNQWCSVSGGYCVSNMIVIFFPHSLHTDPEGKKDLCKSIKRQRAHHFHIDSFCYVIPAYRHSRMISYVLVNEWKALQWESLTNNDRALLYQFWPRKNHSWHELKPLLKTTAAMIDTAII